MYLTKLFFNVVSCYANVEDADLNEKNNMTSYNFFDIACGLNESLIGHGYNFNKTFKCLSSNNFLNLDEKIPVQCNADEELNYYCTYNKFEHEEGCHSLPELCETAYLRCINHTAIEIPIQTTTTRGLTNELVYGPEMNQSQFSTRIDKLLNESDDGSKQTIDYLTKKVIETKATVLPKKELHLWKDTNIHLTPPTIVRQRQLIISKQDEFLLNIMFLITGIIIIIGIYIYKKRQSLKESNSYELFEMPLKRDTT